MAKKDPREAAKETGHKYRQTRNENDVRQAAKRLDPRDDSDQAKYIREVAEDIEDHRSSEKFRNR